MDVDGDDAEVTVDSRAGAGAQVEELADTGGRDMGAEEEEGGGAATRAGLAKEGAKVAAKVEAGDADGSVTAREGEGAVSASVAASVAASVVEEKGEGKREGDDQWEPPWSGVPRPSELVPPSVFQVCMNYREAQSCLVCRYSNGSRNGGRTFPVRDRRDSVMMIELACWCWCSF